MSDRSANHTDCIYIVLVQIRTQITEVTERYSVMANVIFRSNVDDYTYSTSHLRYDHSEDRIGVECDRRNDSNHMRLCFTRDLTVLCALFHGQISL